MSDYLTRVHTYYGRNVFNYYIRFGIPKYRDEYNGREAYEYYAERAVFGYIRWQANEFGTQCWQFYILKAGSEGAILLKVPGVLPGAILLSHIVGKEKIHRLFRVIDQIEALQVDCADVAENYWIQVGGRINSCIDVLPYTLARHHTWMLEREVSA